ncbi:MAG: Hsp20/alpha crystallin family protein [Longimicrobiales bacterium]|nr:Hsp20/alpha crystallin family protein [Longimicrobiales bacterium]
MAITKYSLRRPTYSNWGDLDEVSNRLSRFFDDSLFNFPRESGRWMPPVSVSETADELMLTAELPGMTEDDISIDLENNVLSISGQKNEVREEGDEERRYHVYERHFGTFNRSFTLPRTVDPNDITATFENGILTVRMPKVAEAKGRKIEISK